jgi:membrane-associated protein
MDLLQSLIDFVLHIDRHLVELAGQYGTWIYAILFTIVFCETGLVVTPFLPGDSLLFAVGSLAALGALDLPTALALLAAASFSGDNVNYFFGRTVGPRVFRKEHSRLLNREYLDRTHRFYEKHGGKTIVIARFLPIIRTFAPFVAGIGAMSYRRFLAYSAGGSLLWVSLFTLGGYFFGSIPIVREHFSLVIVALVVIPGLPAAVEFIRHFVARRRNRSTPTPGH